MILNLFNIYYKNKNILFLCKNFKQTLLGKLLPSPNPKCCVGKKINQNITDLNQSIEEVIIKKLEGVSLQDFSMKF